MVEWEQTPVRKINGFEGTEKYRICYISEINHYIRGWGQITNKVMCKTPQKLGFV